MKHFLFSIGFVLALTTQPEARTLLAVGTELGSPLPTGGSESWPLIVRHSGSDWNRIALPKEITGLLNGVSYATAEEVWAYGMAGTLAPLLLRSHDGGQTWIDVSARVPSNAIYLPTEMSIASMAVSRQGRHVALVAHGPMHSGPYVATSEDAGETWTPFLDRQVTIGLRHRVVARADTLTLVRGDASGIHLDDLAKPSTPLSATAGLPTHFNLKDSVAIGDDLLLVGATSTDAEGQAPEAQPLMPAIFRAPSKGIAASVTIDPLPPGHLESIDIRKDRAGIAGGWTGTDAAEALLLYSSDALVAPWHRAEIRSALPHVIVRGVVHDDDRAWAIANTTAPEDYTATALLYSGDSGRSWVRVPGPQDQNAQLFAIAGTP